MTSPDKSDALTLRVDMIRCDGHGICAWLMPERVSLDQWGFPQVDGTALTTRRERARARRVVRACPRRALHANTAASTAIGPTVRS